jgi:protease I
MANDLAGKKVAILATDGFEQAELFDPKKALDEAGATTHVISLKSGKIKGWDMTDWGKSIDVDLTVDDADSADYDMLLLPGGVQNPDKLRVNARAVAFVQEFFEAEKPVAAICHAPWTIIEAEEAHGRTLTSWPSLRTDLENAGAEWVDKEVVVDGNLITSRKPDDISAFNEAILKALTSTLAHA